MNTTDENLSDKKFCGNCGSTASLSTVFCQKCGIRFEGAVEARATAELSLESLIAQIDQSMAAGVNPLELSHLHMAVAVMYLRREETTKAIPYLRQAVELNDSDALAHAYLGVALAEEYQIDEAYAELLKAISLDDQNAVIQLKMAEFKLKLGITQEAQRYLEAALKLPIPTRDTAIYIANLLSSTRKRNQKIIERKSYIPGKTLFASLRKLGTHKAQQTEPGQLRELPEQ
jgi:tetratricopeptide (TPR) repeat protein